MRVDSGRAVSRAQTPAESGFGQQRVLRRFLDDLDHTPMHLALLLEYSASDRAAFFVVISALKASMPPYTTE